MLSGQVTHRLDRGRTDPGPKTKDTPGNPGQDHVRRGDTKTSGRMHVRPRVMVIMSPPIFFCGNIGIYYTGSSIFFFIIFFKFTGGLLFVVQCLRTPCGRIIYKAWSMASTALWSSGTAGAGIVGSRCNSTVLALQSQRQVTPDSNSGGNIQHLSGVRPSSQKSHMHGSAGSVTSGNVLRRA